jgi:hypothetical protein
MLIPSECGHMPQHRWLCTRSPLSSLIPAKAGIQWRRSVGSIRDRYGEWIPALAGMTVVFLGEFAQNPIRSL